MSDTSYEEVNLMLRLYELRREARLRQARSWFLERFHPSSVQEITEKYPQGSEENNSMRMVIGYWEMAASLVNRGLINDELFFENNGEMWMVWDRIRNVVPAWREAFKNPKMFWNLEQTCMRFEAWRENRAPGATAAMRQILGSMRSKA